MDKSVVQSEFLEAQTAFLQDFGNAEKAAKVISAFEAFRQDEEYQRWEEPGGTRIVGRALGGASWITCYLQTRFHPHSMAVLLRALCGLSPHPFKGAIPFWKREAADAEYLAALVLTVCSDWLKQAREDDPLALATFISTGGFDGIGHLILFPPHGNAYIMGKLLSIARALASTPAGADVLRQLRHEPKIAPYTFPYADSCDAKKLPTVELSGSPIELLCNVTAIVSLAAWNSYRREDAKALMFTLADVDKLAQLPLEALDGKWLPWVIDEEERRQASAPDGLVPYSSFINFLFALLGGKAKAPPEHCSRLITFVVHEEILRDEKKDAFRLADTYALILRWNPEFSAEHLAAHRIPFPERLLTPAGPAEDSKTGSAGRSVKAIPPPIHALGLAQLLAARRLQAQGRSCPVLLRLAAAFDEFRYQLEQRFSEQELTLLAPPSVTNAWASALGIPRGVLDSAGVLLPKLARRSSSERKESAAEDLLTAQNSVACANPDCKARTRKTSDFMRCSGCKRVRYCSKECQRAHWRTHKSLCKLWKEAPST